jgi:hypothetical protein
MFIRIYKQKFIRISFRYHFDWEMLGVFFFFFFLYFLNCDVAFKITIKFKIIIVNF